MDDLDGLDLYMDDLDGLDLYIELFSDFRITFVREVEEQNVFRRFGGYPFLTWFLPFGPDDIEDLLQERLEELPDERLNELLDKEECVSIQARGTVAVPGANPFLRGKVGSVLQIGSCEGWTFAIELYGPYEPTKKLLEVISSGTTAVSVQRISSKWLRLLDWAEDGVWKGGGEALGPFMPALQTFIEQAGVDLGEDDGILGDSLFAPILRSAFGIRFPRKALEKSLFTGAFVFPTAEKR